VTGPGTTERKSAPPLADRSISFDHAPWAVVELSPEAHVVHYANALFCDLLGKPRDEVVGKAIASLLPPADGCPELLERVFQTGKAASFIAEGDAAPFPLLYSYTLWPVVVDGQTTGVMIQVNETGPLHEARQAISQALLIGALHQDELIEAADAANFRLQMEVLQRTQGERDARMMTGELTHRVKNNLAVVSALIANEIRRTPEPWVQGYRAMQSRIFAIAHLYDLMSQADRHRSVDLSIYVREIAKGLVESVLDGHSNIRIEVEADPVEINSERAVPFGLLVNELSTNAAKYAFLDGVGLIRLAVRSTGDEIELVVSDDGIGMTDGNDGRSPGKHGSDYVTIFVSQLEGMLTRVTKPGQGTTFTIRFPANVKAADPAHGP
jgi:two-component sensor histidine kinase